MNKLELAKLVDLKVNELLEEKGYVSVVDLLMRLDYLSKADYEQWRYGRIEYLEKVCKVNLSKLSFINKHLRQISNDLNLQKSWTYYKKYGKGNKKKLRFSKSNDEKIEKYYSTHHVLR